MEYYPKEAQHRSNRTQGWRPVDTYTRVFMRLKQFTPKQVDKKLKMVERSILGLNAKIHRTMGVIDPTTYVVALRAAKAMEEPRVEEHWELAVTIGQKRWYLLRELNGLPLVCRHQQIIDIAGTKRGLEETRNHNAMHVDSNIELGVWSNPKLVPSVAGKAMLLRISL